MARYYNTQSTQITLTFKGAGPNGEDKAVRFPPGAWSEDIPLSQEGAPALMTERARKVLRREKNIAAVPSAPAVPLKKVEVLAVPAKVAGKVAVTAPKPIEVPPAVDIALDWQRSDNATEE